jgi:alkanesulfonate monooxygenase SsuD/methylene tetrahydromethanopterin reductase-like flavin-dependent oxidoreductase (luciferase family)
MIMRFGICILQDRRWRQAEARWRDAEAYGFDHAWVYDHLGWRELVDGPWFDGVVTLTAAAAVTSTIRLGTLVASPNFRHPVPFAREITTLDDVCAGRLLLGVGAGGEGHDAEVLGRAALSAGERAGRFIEFVELLDQLLVRQRVSWNGTWYTAVDARATPGCASRPRVPFVVAANGPRTIALAARLGQGWVTTGTVHDSLDGWWTSVAAAAATFDAALDAAGRRDGDVARYLSLDAAPRYSLSSVAAFTEAVDRAEALGFTDVITHWPREHGWYAGDRAVLEAVASTVLPARR